MEYSIKINDFEGPLDLLLHLIKKSGMDILNINIEDITNQYLNYIQKMDEMNLEVASSYLVMASELIEMKSKVLLPSTEEVEEEEENSKDNLIKKLIDYQRYKDLTEELKVFEQKRKEYYTKSPENINNYVEKIPNNDTMTVSDLLVAFNAFLERQKEKKPLHTKITTKEYSVKSRIKEIKTILLEKKCLYFEELFEVLEKDYVIVTFLSILEMAKENTINIKQENNFQKIYLELKVQK